ncbi:MAG TPA: hypothetical protein VGE07_25535 [Herpetosiphonaceae bacterium]
MSGGRLYLLSVGPQRLLADGAAVASVRRLHGGAAGEQAALHTERGRVGLYDLADWLGAAPGAERRVVLVVELEDGPAGLLADAIDDTVQLDAPPEPLPALLRELGCDPAVTAVAFVAGIPRLMVDLAEVARSHRAGNPLGGALAQGV